MKNVCENCGEREASKNHFLCYECKRAERDTQLRDIDDAREFKFNVREALQAQIQNSNRRVR